MNLFNDLVKIRIIFLIAILQCVTGSLTFSQTNQFIDPVSISRSALELIADSMPVNIRFTNKGFIIFLSGNSVIVSDSDNREQFVFHENPYLLEGNTYVYYYTSSDAGYFYSDTLNKFVCKSYQDHFRFPFTRINEMHTFNDALYLKADSSLFQIRNKKLRLIDPEFQNGRFLSSENHLFIFKPGYGIIRVDDNFPGSEYTSLGRFIPDLLIPFPEGYILYASENNRFLILKEKENYKVRLPVYRKWWFFTLLIVISFLIMFIAYKRLIYKYLRMPPPVQEYPVSELVTKELPKSELFSQTLKPVPADKSKWEKYEVATVLFSDIQGFTKIAEQMNPEMLIDELDRFFFHFDSVCEKYGIEKIKTIGDAYMAAGGIPQQSSTNPVEVVLAALEMLNYMKQLKNSKTDIWDLRIGIHSGPVIGGIIGHKKRSYDIWGDTVNTASRMESSGEPGRINISGTTFNIIKEFFICEYRGKLPVKYKGNIDMYFVKGLRPELSVNLGSVPNRIFYFKLQQLRLNDLENFIFNRLESEMPRNLYFHTIQYIKHLYSYSELLSKAESLNLEEEIIIKTSVLFLFTGLAGTYQSFENKSADYARQLLPGYKFSDKQINSIYNLILFSKIQEEPQNVLEKIMHDVVTEFYGRADYITLYKLLFLEVNENTGKLIISKWKEQQIRKLKGHQYYTLSGRRLREISGEQQISNIELDEWQ